MRALAVLVMVSFSMWGQARQRPQPPSGPQVQEGVSRLILSLPAGSHWRYMLEHGLRGDGVRRPWMDDMRERGVKLGTFTFEFTWVKRGRELKGWRLVSQQYFRDYDGSEPITGRNELDALGASGLEGQLEAEALVRAKHGIWVEYPAEETGTGYRVVELAENEWLPVQMVPWFGQYEPGTTPLMRAALLGDAVRIKKLLAQGADVNAVSPNGSTALIYASASGNPAAVGALLNAGADVSRTMKAGGDALTAAVVSDQPENVSLLLRAGADPNSRGLEGQSALSIAIERHYADIAKLLRQAGARK